MAKSFLLVFLCGLLVAGSALAREITASERLRVWIDTDAACGAGARTDPDDCFALAYLLGRDDLDIVGVSTVFGNAPLEETDRITRLVLALEQDSTKPPIPVYRGAAAAGAVAASPASRALVAALESGPLTILALGPLTNLQAVFEPRPTLATRVTQLVVMMGKREGHLFHPTEGAEGAMLFGHGPIFRDFNFCEDSDAVRALMDIALPTILIPYELARQVLLSGSDLARLERVGVPNHPGGAGARVAEIARRSSAWLSFWQTSVGHDGFYPFDLVAAIYLTRPDYFSCAKIGAWIGSDRKAYGPFAGPEALMVAARETEAIRTVTYCDRLTPSAVGAISGEAGFHDHMMSALGAPLRPAL
ncbi:MAG: hypothetical protein COA62_12620 [Rhodobiaceae bacterium]|nr:MAG: hypothetical protein COA62_12620 [Rhodobiaceae bacterium]